MQAKTFILISLWITAVNLSFSQTEKFAYSRDISLETSDVSTAVVDGDLFLLTYTEVTTTDHNHKQEVAHFELNKNKIKTIVTTKPRNLTLSLLLMNEKVMVEFERVNIFSENFHIKTSSGKVIYPDFSETVYYRGTIKNKKDNWVTLSIVKGEIKLLFATDQNNYEIVKENKNTGYIGYNTRQNAKVSSCSTPEENTPNFRPNSREGSRYGSCIEVAFETDYSTYLAHGSDTTTILRWTGDMLNDIAALYNVHNVPLILSQLFIWDTVDPYNSTNNLTSMRDQFVNTLQNNYTGRIAILLSTRDLGGGISYGIGGHCNVFPAYPGPFAVSTGLSTTRTAYPNYSYNTYILAHELGHVMGLRHTHACVWNNTETQIDDCGNVYANDNNQTPEGASCFTPASPVLPSSGTVMSQCHLLNGVGISLNLGFGSIAGPVLVNNLVFSSCNNGTSCAFEPPINDFCIDAILLPLNNSCQNNIFSNIAATATTGPPTYTCGSPGMPVRDIWFKVVMPASGSVNIASSQYSGGLTDVIVQAYSGACNNLIAISCDDNSGPGNHFLLTISGRTSGETIYFRVVDSGSNDAGYFQLCAYDSNLPCHPDYTALVGLYNGTGGGNWVNRNGWQAGAAGTNCNVCTWYGVTCNEQNRVIGINLSSNDITGTLPNSITSLTFLNTLRLYGNELSGSLPSFLNSFLYLKTVDFGSNSFSGDIPSNFGSIASLKNLYLDDNNLNGSLPISLVSINLGLFYVNDNNISGCFPAGYSIFCNKAVDFSNNPNLANNTSFSNYCSSGIGGDEDGDNYCRGLGDCDDDDNTMYPGNIEVCDNKDNDCNGLIDDIASPMTNTWIGGSGDWNDVAKWTLGIPQRCQNVVIGGNTSANITINGAPAVARSVTVNASRTLTISNGAELNIDNGMNIINNGTVNNSGTILVRNILDSLSYGINNAGSFQNNAGAMITVFNSGFRAIHNSTAGNIVNSGMLTIDGYVGTGISSGFYTLGTFSNLGTVTVRNINGYEIHVLSNAVFNNQAGGVINLD